MKRSEDPRIIKTKRDLKKALTDALEDHSLSEIRIQDLCASAMVNKTTFYRHYRDIYDIYGEILSDMYSRSLDSFDEYDLFFNDPAVFFKKLTEKEEKEVRFYRREMQTNPVDFFSGLYENQVKKKIYGTGRIAKNDMNEMKLDIILHAMKELNVSGNTISKTDKYKLFEKIVFSLYPKTTK